MLSIPVSLGVALSAILSVVGDKPDNRTLHYIFKPATMLIIIGACVFSGINDTSFAYWLLAGLGLSLLGDIFLMLPSDKFIHGLASFLVAHIAYVIGFSQLYEGSITPLWLGGVIVFSLTYFAMLFGSLGKLKVPVLVYVTAISLMVWMAGELYFDTPSQTHLLLMLGAIIFAISDASLAWNKFKQAFSWAQWLILTTYFGAQWLIAQAMLAS